MKTSLPSLVHLAISTIAAMFVLGWQPAVALDTWTRLPANGPGPWTDGANWSNGIAPNGPGNEEGRIDNGGTAVIDDSQTDPFTFILGEITTGSLTLGPQPGTSGNLLMTSGKFTLKNTDFRIGGNPVTNIGGGVPTIGGIGVFTQTGGTVIQQGGNLNVGFRGLNSTDPTVAEGTYNLSGNDSSYTVMFGFIIVIGNRATGTLNQSGGTIEVKNLATTNNGTLGSLIQLGRNAVNATSFTNGTYNLSGGSATAALFRFGSNVTTTAVAVNTLNLSGTGRLQTGAIEIGNTGATNIFNFTGGALSANTVSLPVTNNGGTLSPYFADFSPTFVTATTGALLNPVGTMTFTGTNSYVQSSNGTLAIDIDFGSNDLVDIGAGAPVVPASIAGKISVNLLNGFDPPVGSTFDILTADSITYTASVIGHTPSCNVFKGGIVIGLDGREVLRLVVVAPPALYSEYQGLYGAGSFGADDDNDGLFNGVEYLLGLLPNDPNGAEGAAGAPVLSLTGSGANKRLRIEFSIPEPGPTDATLRVEASDDLGVTDPWTTIATKVGQGPWTGTATITVDPALDCKVHVAVDDTKLASSVPTRSLRVRGSLP